MNIDKNQVTLLGFQQAGWDEYRKILEKQSVKVHTTTNPILPEDKSIYWSAHSPEELKQKSLHKNKDPRSVASALSHVIDTLSGIEEPDTRRAIITHVLESVLQRPRDVVEAVIRQVEAATDPTNEMLNQLMDETADGDENLCQDASIELNGYTLVSLLRDESLLKACLKGNDMENHLKDLSEWVFYVDLDTKSEVIQKTLAVSKSMITDTLQMNLLLLKTGKPLVPIHFVVAAEALEDSPAFFPNWRKTINKEGFVLTNAEVRMVYKLMQEIDDPLVNQIMKNTVTFYKKGHHGFEAIPMPWQGNSDWVNRRRSGDKPAHRERPASQIQPWIKKLRTLSDDVQQTIKPAPSLVSVFKKLDISKTMDNGSAFSLKTE